MIITKRNSLEKFLREQLIGPGGCNYQYTVKHDEKEEEFDPDLSFGEVVNTTPGSLYSSAILFPKKAQIDNPVQPTISEVETNDIDGNDDEVDDDNDNDTVDNIREQLNVDHQEDIDALGRRFPNRFGISCCLDEKKVNDKLCITISGRYYRQVKCAASLRIKIDDIEGFQQFINDPEYKRLIGQLVAIDGNAIKIVMGIKPDDLKSKKESLREVNKYFCKKIATNTDGTLCNIYDDANFNPDYRFLSAYKERLFLKLNNFDINGNYTSAARVDEIKAKIQKVEKYETYLSYMEDVLGVFDTRAFGFWEAVNFKKTLDLSDIDLASKRVFKAEDYPALKNIVKVILRSSEDEESKEVSLSLDVWLQAIKSNGKIYLKVLLVNSSTPVVTKERSFFSIVTKSVNERSFFGVTINISSPHLLEYHKDNTYDANDEEANALRYLYRNIKDYGVGHLCSVNWGRVDGVMNVWSEFLPAVETPDVEPIPQNKKEAILEKDGNKYAKPYLESSQCLQFKWLSVFSDATNEEIVASLFDFVETYKQWIDNLDAKDNSIAQKNKDLCEHDYLRIKNNIKDFLVDPDKLLSFRLMNAAMFMQLWHNTADNKAKVKNERNLSYDFYREKADDTTIFKGMHAAWRPFQLAFILLNLDGIFQRNKNEVWTERNELVDLVWFPTGGGKTEAYLGIIALTIINRRRTQGVQGGGTAAIMRYTLRLLTTQQFQRALRLIMALEKIRLWNDPRYKLGENDISIGLFVGKGSLPNTNQELIDETNNWDQTHGKIPLDTCPWCGSEIQPVRRGGEQHFRCSNLKCSFGRMKKLPVCLCDEHIYNNPPTLLFGTVDKFAQLAHKVDNDHAEKNSRRIFGEELGCLPPDLIIQDELHLLLGPLGSAVSLFECAIDQLCTREDEHGNIVRPKIISSTATTRNTSLQIRALYDRKVSIFPKSGTDYDDSFFAFYKRFKKENDSDWTFLAKRKYIGVLPTGRTQMTTQIRLAAILFVHRAIFELENIDKLNEKDFIKAADYYYTVISYFNSLREVGKTDAQFYQEFTKYTRRLFKRVLRHSHMLECLYVYNDHFRKSELTGRLTGEEAVKELDNVQNQTWDPIKRLPYQDEQNKWQRAKNPADMILATNMISVGLDVSRFNTIIMNSMPRNIAEYIQASSRVARDKEGLVLTLHSPFNQRDVSHFEKFREFHEKLYYYVEPISITPFSPKSVERFLPLYLAAIIRQKYANLGNRKCAGNITKELSVELKTYLKRYFERRAERSAMLPEQEASILTPKMLTIIKQQIDKCIDIWLEEAQRHGENLVYFISRYGRGNNNTEEVSLFASPEDFEGNTPADKWLVPNALRVIEPESVIHVIR